MSIDRRQFMFGCGAAIAALAGARVSSLAFAQSPAPPASQRTLVVVFLRGGMDGLHLLAPMGDPDYEAARPAELRVTASGDHAGKLIGAMGPREFALHHAAQPLAELYDAGLLAFIHACGLTHPTRSHFEAMDLMERGVADSRLASLSTGWLARAEAALPPGLTLPVVSMGSTPPASLLGSTAAAAMASPADFSLWADPAHLNTIAAMYERSDLPLAAPGRRAANLVGVLSRAIQRSDDGSVPPYAPANGAQYPDGELGRALAGVARLIKADAGLSLAAVDFGGWDTHQNQPAAFTPLTRHLSNSLRAFMTDLADRHQRLTVLVMSEFGRRLKANRSQGTDHGHAGVMLALGGNVIGGRIHGDWPTLANDRLDAGADLAVTTDYRAVLAEALAAHGAAPDPALVFPGDYTPTPVGVFRS